MYVCRPRWQNERRRSVSLQVTAVKDGTDDDAYRACVCGLEEATPERLTFTIDFDAATKVCQMRMDKLGTGYQTRELLLQDISKSSFQH